MCHSQHTTRRILLAAVFAIFGLIGASLPSAAATTESAAAGSFTIPGDIPSDCTVDVTSQILSWIASVPDGSVLEFGAGACYQVENTLLISGRHELTFVGHDATFVAKTTGASQTPPPNTRKWPRTRAHWKIQQSSDIAFSDVNVIGANPYTGRVDRQYNPLYEAQHGFQITESTGVTIADSTISKVWGDFVTIAGGSSNVVVRNNRMTTSGRQGIAVTRGSHIEIDGNVINDMRWGFVDIEPNVATDVVDDVRITNNTTGNARWHLLAAIGPSTHITNIVVEHNTMTGGALSVLYARNRTPSEGLFGPFTVAHNDLKAKPTGYPALQWTGAQAIAVYDNVVRAPKGSSITMIWTASSDGVQVHDNDFTRATMILDPTNSTNWCEEQNRPLAKSRNVPCG